ncbi:MAG: DUF1684 domain-containing protein [Nitritalea sp.]
MNKRNILLVGVLVVVALAFVYTLTRTDDPEVYVEKIERERDRQFKYLKFNTESPLSADQRRDLQELDYFPIEPAYRVRARIEPVQNKKMLEIPKTDGSVGKYIKHSYAVFELKGTQHRLLLLQAANEADKRNFFLAFNDKSNGEGTYGGGRYIDLRQDGQSSITIDFNLAYNPYCAYNPDYACPIPPAENELSIPIFAGEKDYEQ